MKNNSALPTESSGVGGLQAPHVRALHVHLGPRWLRGEVTALVTEPSGHCFRLHFRRVVLDEGIPQSCVFYFSKLKNAEAHFVSREHSKQSTLLGVTCVWHGDVVLHVVLGGQAKLSSHFREDPA